MKKINRLIITCLSVFTLMFVLATPVLSAVDLRGQLDKTGAVLYDQNQSGESKLIPQIGGIIKAVISLLGVALLLYFLYAGYLWMTAGGDKSQVEKAQEIIKNTVMGMALILVSYALTGFVVDLLLQSAGGNP